MIRKLLKINNPLGINIKSIRQLKIRQYTKIHNFELLYKFTRHCLTFIKFYHHAVP